MEPIISPWSIYFADVLPSLGNVSLAIGIVATAAFLILIIFWGIVSFDHSLDEETNKTFKKLLFKICLPILFVGYLISILTPNKKTIYTMMVVNQITPHNIEILGDSAKDVVDYITDEIKELTKEEKTEESK
jgi:diacylglycerol kinase